MAEDPATNNTTNNQKSSDKDENLETTTAKDGSLPINVSPPVEASTPPPVIPTAPTVPPAPEAEKPIMVTESDVQSVTSSVPTESKDTSPEIANEIENLSGEIQALEAKIDRLTGNIKAVSETAPIEKAATNTEPPQPPQPAENKPKDEPVKINKPVEASAAMPDRPAPKSSPVDDIYSRVGNEEKAGEGVLKTPDSDEAHEVGGGSSLAIIGEVLTVFGIISFLLMIAYPLYGTLLSNDVKEAVRLIGWPTTVVGLAIGFILSLFSKGKVTVKIFALLILLMSVIFYFGVAGFERFLGPLAGLLDPVLSFYR